MASTSSSRLRKLRNLPARGVITVISGFLLHLSLGSMYTFGNLTTYLTSYLHVRQGLDVDYGQTNWIGTALALFQGPSLFIGSLMYAKVGGFATMTSGCVLLTSAMVLTYFTVKSSLGLSLLTYGVMNGCGTGLTYSVPLLVGYKWFPNNRGLVTGIVVGGYGLGGVFFTAIQTSFINPDNLSPNEDDGFFHDEDLLDRVPYLFLLQAGICAALQIVGVLGIREQSKEMSPTTQTSVPSQDRNDNMEIALEETKDPQQANSNMEVSDTNHPWFHAFKTLTAWQLLLSYDMNGMSTLNINGFWKSFGQTFIQDDHFLELVGSVSAIFNLLGRVVWGLICDKLSYKHTMMMLTGLLTALLFTWQSTSEGGKVMYAMWVWALFFAFSGTYSIVIAGAAEIFGQESTGPVYGVIFMTASFLSPLMALLVEFILEKADYSVLFLVLGVSTSISLMSTMSLQHPRKHVDDATENGGSNG